MGEQLTPYPDVNAALHELFTDIQAIVGGRFRAMYLSGSLALGDFDPQRSDVDFVVVTDAALPGDIFAALRDMHARFDAGGSPWATEVEAVYIPQDALRHHDPAHAYHPHVERGESLVMDQLDDGWVLQRYILREHGVVVAGPHPRTLIDPVGADEMRRAVVVLMEQWWGPMRGDPTKVRQRGYQVYAVLTMCRVLYTLDTGGIVSKPQAARWTQQGPGRTWAALIERALAWRKDPAHLQDRSETARDDVSETLDLIGYTLERCQAWKQPPRRR